jgi:starch-binding outer membrane protein, SusD/RagB family
MKPQIIYTSRLIILGFIISFIPACNLIDLKPTDSIDSNDGLNTLDAVEQATDGIYSSLRSVDYYGRNYLTLPDMMSDNVRETVESLSNYRNEVDWLYTSNSTEAEEAWEQPYEVINRANIVIEAIDKVSGSQQRKNRSLGQALALRALGHFDLLRYYGQSYDRNSTALGIPIKTKSDLSNPARNTVKEVYDQIFADLNQAKTALADIDKSINTSSNRKRIDLLAVNALAARVSLYAGLWADAITFTSAILDELPDAGLSSFDDFESVWSDDEPSNEIIWSISYTTKADIVDAVENENGTGVGDDLYFVPNDRSSFAPSAALVALYDKDNDIRYSSYILEEPSRPTSTFIVGKYLGRGGNLSGINDAKVFRAGEMYLIRAEAYARNGQDALGMADLNALRNARIDGYVDENLTGTALLNAIAIERRKELAFEGHRWFDLRRTGQAINRGTDWGLPSVSQSLPANSPKFIWPIPQSEIFANKEMEQNAGY